MCISTNLHDILYFLLVLLLLLSFIRTQDIIKYIGTVSHSKSQTIKKQNKKHKNYHEVHISSSRIMLSSSFRLHSEIPFIQSTISKIISTFHSSPSNSDKHLCS